MFAVTIEDLPPQTLPVKAAKIELFYWALSGSDRISLHVEAEAEARAVPVGEGETHTVAPVFYTGWLTIPVSALTSRGPDALDGYRMIYDATREAELGFDQFPGAIYQDMHAGFSRATMEIDHVSGATYRISAEGETEFGWTFRLTATAPLVSIALRDDNVGSTQTPNLAVEAEFARLFDPSHFACAWTLMGNPDNSWHQFVAKPRDTND